MQSIKDKVMGNFVVDFGLDQQSKQFIKFNITNVEIEKTLSKK